MEPNTLILFAVLTSSCLSPSHDATRAAQKAYFTQSGIERNLHEWERKHISEEIRNGVGNVALVSKTMIERKVVFNWTFP